MAWKPDDEEKTPALLPWRGSEIVPAATDRGRKRDQKGFFCFIAHCWQLLKGYTASDIDRLKEAGVRQVEGKAKKDLAEADARIGEAAKAHAEAERARAEAEKLRAEAYAIRKHADSDALLAQVDALQRFEAAISAIKQQGGDVAFSKEEIVRLIWRGKHALPDQPEIREAAKELSE